jgi:tetratricopeptide (TPR) repeat protein
MSSGRPNAVFLSYASQDAAAVERIAQTLRAAGVEVWFDRNELVGGDAWDAKIREQIKTCALFVPVISAHTNARREGYFRREWKLAVDRTHDMDEALPFLLPVVLDATADAAAFVPAKFRDVQWTRLPGGETPEQFCVRVQQLLAGLGVGGAWRPDVETHSMPSGRKAPAAFETGRRGRPVVVGVLVALAAAVAVGAWWQRERARRSVATVGSGAVHGAAEGLIRQARELVYDADAARHEFALAEGLIKRATELAPDSGEAWGVSALLQQYFASRAYATDTKERLRRAREQAEKALRLAPDNVDALLALGMNRVALAGRDAGRPFLERAAGLAPGNPKATIGLSMLREPAERVPLLTEAAQRSAQPAELWYYAASAATRAGRAEEARGYLERARAARPLWRIWVAEAHVEYFLTADADRVEAWLQRVPELRRDDPRVVFFRWRVALLRGDGAAALRAVSGLADEFIEDNFYSGPKALLQAQANEAAGQSERAKQQWALAARLLREKLVAEPGDMLWQAELAVALSATAPAQAREIAGTVATGELELPDARRWREIDALEFLAQAYVRLDQPAEAIAALRRNREFKGETGVSQAMLRNEKRWEPLRGRPDFAASIADGKGR